MLVSGFTPEAVDAVGAWPDPVDPRHFTPVENTVLRYDDQMVLANMGGALDAGRYAELRTFFDDGQIVELSLLMAFFTGMAKWLMTADLVPKLASCPLPGAAGVGPDLDIVPAAGVPSYI
jgi:alkylhydroperoxidase family enzyme